MTLKFNNEAIKRHRSKFKKGKSGKIKPVITSFKLDRNTEYKGLCLREYVSGVKHFIIRFRLRGERKKERIFPIGRFDLIEDPQTKQIGFGVEQCKERLIPIVREHTDTLGRWLKNPNDTVKFTKVKASKTINEVIEAYCKKGFPKTGKEEKYTGNTLYYTCINNTGRLAFIFWCPTRVYKTPVSWNFMCDKIFFFFYFLQQTLNKIEFYIPQYVSI